jgi:ankyrin repeat protein
MVACGRFGGDRVVIKLIADGADPCAEDDEGWTPLHYACRYGRIGTVWLLLQAGANLQAQETQHGWRPSEVISFR